MKNGRKLFRRIPRFGRLNLGCAIIVMVICTALVPAAASSPVVAQEQTSWYVNDDPSLFGPSEYWYWGDPGHGYGSNYYRYTYAIGGARSADNWARWSMGPRVGLQEIQVYVPSNHATATVYYNITIGSRTFRRSVAQASISGWHSLGNWDAGGADVVVAVYDNDAGHHKDRHGYSASRIGVDAIRMRCVSRCSAGPPAPVPDIAVVIPGDSTPPPPPPQPPPPDDRSMTLALGADRSGCPTTNLPCRWLTADFSGFSRGSYTARCYWSTSSNRLGTSFATFTATGRDDSRFCWYNGTPGRYLTAVEDGVRSNTVRFARSAAAVVPGNTPPPPSPPQAEFQTPSQPRDLTVRADARRLTVSWSAPRYDGGSPVSGYRVQIYTGGRRLHSVDLSSGSRSTNFGDLTPDTAYVVWVSATNQAGRGTAAQTTSRTRADTLATTTTTTAQPPQGENNSNDQTNNDLPPTMADADAGRATVPPPVSAVAEVDPPTTGDITDRDPDERSGRWTRVRNWYAPLISYYWRTSSSEATATWWLGDIQGIYNFHWLLNANNRHDGRVKWQVFEKRDSDSQYELIQTFWPRNQKDRDGWKWYSTELHLDGSVKIVATRRSGTVAVDDVRLRHVAMLPKYEGAAIQNCLIEHARFMGLGQTLAKVLVAIPLGYFAGVLVAGGAGTTYLAEAVVGAATELGLEAFGIEEWLDDLNEDTASHNCSKFKHSGFNLPWDRGHSAWANDIAKASLTGQLCYQIQDYGGKDCVSIPVRGTRP